MLPSIIFTALLALPALALPPPASPTPSLPIQLGIAPPLPLQPAPTPLPLHLQNRDILSSISSATSALAADVSSALAALPTGALAGLLSGFTDLPDADEIKSKLNISDEELDAAPVKIVNIPGYANWTSTGWSLRVHGFTYKLPNLTTAQIDSAASIFLPTLNTSALNSSELTNSRNLTTALLAIPWPNQILNFTLVDPSSESNPGGLGPTGLGSGAPTPDGSGNTSYVGLLNPTTDVGEFDELVNMGRVLGVGDGNGTGVGSVTRKDLLSGVDTMTGNASAFFVPEEGLTIVSDIDDILRVTKIYQPEQGLLNTFAYNFTSWMNMPEIYKNWSESIPDAHFHYLTTTPEQATRVYEAYIAADYPLGSFDDRPLNFTTVDQTIAIRKVRLQNVIEAFPKRKFVLVADVSNADVMKDYPAAMKMYPDQVVCILLRNTSIDTNDSFPYDTSGFEGLSNNSYSFFRTPDDLMGINLVDKCRNTTFEQNVTYGYQNLPSVDSVTGSSGAIRVKNAGAALMGGLMLVGALVAVLL